MAARVGARRRVWERGRVKGHPQGSLCGFIERQLEERAIAGEGMAIKCLGDAGLQSIQGEGS
jgi:hypothetical protein